MEDKNAISLSTSSEELENRLLSETDVDNLQDIINIFNLNIKRKDILRINKLSDLQDVIFNQMNDRLQTNADAFSNKDLLEYFKAVQDTINKTDKTLNSVDVGAIQITQNQLNVNVDEKLNRESRAKILDAVNAILTKTKVDSSETLISEETSKSEDSIEKPIDVEFKVEGEVAV